MGVLPSPYQLRSKSGRSFRQNLIRDDRVKLHNPSKAITLKWLISQPYGQSQPRVTKSLTKEIVRIIGYSSYLLIR